MLSDGQLREAHVNHELRVTPSSEDMLQPASIDLILDNRFSLFRPKPRVVVDPSLDQSEHWQRHEIDWDSYYDIAPGEFLLAQTYEKVSIGSNLVARVEGKSSIGRLGLIIHTTAGFIDPGFHGRITLELVNLLPNNPIRIRPGQKIGQMAVHEMLNDAEKPYGYGAIGSRYQGQDWPEPSRMHLNFFRRDRPADR